MTRLLIFALVLAGLGVNAQTKSYAAYLRLSRMNVDDSKYVLPSVVNNVQDFKKRYYGIGGEMEVILNGLVLDGEISILSHGVASKGTSYAEPFEGAVLGKNGCRVI